MATMPWGKYEDQPLGEVPDQYLVWLVAGATDGLEDDLVHAIRSELHHRAVAALAESLGRKHTISRKTLRLVVASRRQAEAAGASRLVLARLDEQIIRLSHHRTP